jgi:hypothetical protein
MARSKRRRGRGPRRPPGVDAAGSPAGTGKPAEGAGQQAAGAEPQASGAPKQAAGDASRRGGRRRRRRSPSRAHEPSALEQMAAERPGTLQTLPSEGLVLDEIVDAMREEYGYPATPQEYRLIVRVAPEEPERPSGGRSRRPSVSAAERASARTASEVEAPAQGPGPRRGRWRRRRRGRGRGGPAGPAGEGGKAPEGNGDTGAED